MRRKLLQLFGTCLALSTVIYWAAAAAPLSARQQKKAAVPPPAADVKVRTKMSVGGSERGMEMLLYVKGVRMRSEMASAGMGMTNITQCDLKRNISVNDKTRTYLITPMGETSPAASGVAGASPAPGAASAPGATRRGGVVNVVNTVTDTGERRQMFGFEARHLKTSMTMDASPDACNPGNTRVETDGWYIDFEFGFACPGQPQTYTPAPVQARPGCEDEVRTRTIGKARLGYPVLVTTTVHGKDGATTTMTNEVVELTRSPLDAALFDVPAGYTLAANQMELYGMGGGAAAVAAGPGRTSGGASAGDPAAADSPAGAAPAGMVSASAPKREGAVRIGIVVPRAQMTAAGGAAQAAEAVRNTFAGYLGGPGVEVVALGARLPSQALAEARESQCDYVLYASLTQKKGGGGGMFGRALGNIAGAAAGHIPGGSTAGSAAARSATISGVYTTASIANSVKARDELSLEYKLEATDGARPGVARTEKAKANADGEDVLTPLVERAAGAITAVVKR